jgi:Domain of unknown function (DUF932)
MELFKASHQWSTRPADERFETLQALLKATKEYAETAQVVNRDYADIRAEKVNDDVMLVGKGNRPAAFTNWAFKQLCQRIEAPAQYLAELPATLAVQNINHGLKEKATGRAAILMHANGALLCRAFLSEKYTRIWNWEIAERLIPLVQHGWRVPPARPALENQPGTRLATAADVLQTNEGGGGLSINVGDLIAPAGIYASDHDMFVFLVNEQARVNDGTGNFLKRGVFVENSEVGDSALKVTRFLYNNVCGNHIVWGAKNVAKISIRHIGDLQRVRRSMQQQMQIELVKYANESVSDEEARIRTAKKFVIGATKEEVLDALFGKRSLNVPLKRLSEAYDAAEQHPEDGGAPNTAWGMAQGLTRVSQQIPYADQRNELDRAAGKVLDLVF